MGGQHGRGRALTLDSEEEEATHNESSKLFVLDHDFILFQEPYNNTITYMTETDKEKETNSIQYCSL